MMAISKVNCLLILGCLALLARPTAAFGAGNIASISSIEGRNFRHGDIEDMLKTIAFIKGHKWTTMMVKRVYFGNWLRDYSQAMDVGSLKGIQAETVRILVWVLSFLSFGYATGEFEVTSERLGVYRPEEHIDNPKDYADNQDARKYDPRLRGPVQPIELEIDPKTGMKNYIANEALPIATSIGYVKFSFTRSIHFGRVYTNGANGRGNEADLCEALRCLGQGLHCLEDFGAHSNYCELALREMGYRNVFPHTGHAAEINLKGQRVFPLITGTFGVVDFLHSVLGEATDHFAQTEVEQMDVALRDAENQSSSSNDRGFSGVGGSNIVSLLSQIPGAGGLAQQAEGLQARSQADESSMSEQRAEGLSSNIPGTNIDPLKTAAQIYPILEFRDKVCKMLAVTIEKIPGLEALVEKITDTLTLFILSLLAPYIRPIINAVSDQLKNGSSGIIDASGRHQFEPWTDPNCTDPTHSLLSKDHFSNILNEPAGKVASSILQYVAPRIIYAWQHPDIPVEQVLNDVTRVFHHPAVRDRGCEIHQTMYSVLEAWARGRPDGGSGLDYLLGSDSVKAGRNHTVPPDQQGQHNHSGLPQIQLGKIFGAGSHSKVSGAPWNALNRFRDGPEGLDSEGREIGITAEEISAAFPGTQTQYDDVPSMPESQPPQTSAPYPSQSSASMYAQMPQQQQQFQGPGAYLNAAPPYQSGPTYGFNPGPGPPSPMQYGYAYQQPPGPSMGYGAYQGPPPPMPPQQQQPYGYGYSYGGPPPPGQYYNGGGY